MATTPQREGTWRASCRQLPSKRSLGKGRDNLERRQAPAAPFCSVTPPRTAGGGRTAAPRAPSAAAPGLEQVHGPGLSGAAPRRPAAICSGRNTALVPSSSFPPYTLRANERIARVLPDFARCFSSGALRTAEQTPKKKKKSGLNSQLSIFESLLRRDTISKGGAERRPL